MNENQPATVGGTGASPAFPKQAGEAPARWAWVERYVWTERRLKRLDERQEQTVWFKYPIAWFAAQGLFSLKNAQTQWLQSQTGNH